MSFVRHIICQKSLVTCPLEDQAGFLPPRNRVACQKYPSSVSSPQVQKPGFYRAATSAKVSGDSMTSQPNYKWRQNISSIWSI